MLRVFLNTLKTETYTSTTTTTAIDKKKRRSVEGMDVNDAEIKKSASGSVAVAPRCKLKNSVPEYSCMKAFVVNRSPVDSSYKINNYIE
jgi:hypothetical protein